MKRFDIESPYGFAIPETPWVFIHITKTGGTSLRKAFNFPKIKDCGHRKHLMVSDFDEAFETLDSFKFWTVVRNPFDRLRSLWKYQVRKGVASADFNEFVKNKWNREEFKPSLSRNSAAQHDWISDKTGCPHIHHLMHFENFSEDLRGFGEKIGVPDLAQNCPQINVNTYENSLVDAYTDEMMEIVRTLYASDFEMFGYNPDSLTDLSHDPSRAQIKTLPC